MELSDYGKSILIDAYNNMDSNRVYGVEQTVYIDASPKEKRRLKYGSNELIEKGLAKSIKTNMNCHFLIQLTENGILVAESLL